MLSQSGSAVRVGIAVVALLFAQASIAAAGLVGYWSFDAVDGSANFVDLSGNDNTAMPRNGASIAAGKIGNGVHTNGIDQYVEALDSPELRLRDNFTMALWFKSDSTTQTSKYLLSRNGSGKQYAAIYEYANDKVEFYGPNHTGADPRPNSEMALADTNFHHIVYAKQGSNWSGYLDGQQIFSVARDFVLDDFAANVRIGSASPGANHVAGTFDDVAMWDQGLTAPQVKALAAGISNPMNAAWRIDGATYQYTGSILPPGTPARSDDNRTKLTDAVLGSSSFDDGKWVAFRDPFGFGGDNGQPQPQIDFDLGSVQAVDAMRIDYLAAHGAGIFEPDSVEISFYRDSAFGDLVRTVTGAGFATTDGVFANTIDWPSVVEARYVRLKVYNDQEWTWLDEVTFFAAPEPGTWVLMLLGGMGLVAWRRRTTRKPNG
jgi:hypothetical protein